MNETCAYERDEHRCVFGADHTVRYHHLDNGENDAIGDAVPPPPLTQTSPPIAWEYFHVGRSWSGTPLEDGCPCPKEPCGLVQQGKADPACIEHPMGRAKSMRQAHPAKSCPGGAA